MTVSRILSQRPISASAPPVTQAVITASRPEREGVTQSVTDTSPRQPHDDVTDRGGLYKAPCHVGAARSAGSSPDPGHVRCADYLAHRFAHRWTADGWICEECEP